MKSLTYRKTGGRARPASLLPQLISIAVVAVVHLWRRNSLLSIGSGTVCFMLLSRLVFA